MHSSALRPGPWLSGAVHGSGEGKRPAAPGGRPGAAPGLPASGRPPLVLVAGACRQRLSGIDDMLRPDCRVLQADSGQAALALAQERSPDLILLEIGLPDGNGVELCRRFKAHEPTEAIPVMLISAGADDEIHEMAFRNGAVDVIAMPAREPELRARLRQQLRLRRREQQILQHALYDSLTQLPNRSLGMDRLRHALIQDQRDGLVTALMFIDLDKFKQINDSLGHEAGDALLSQAARRLSGQIRLGDTVARMGGDEFVVVLRGLPDAAAAQQVADGIQQAFEAPFELRGLQRRVGVSLGGALSPADAEDARSLLAAADAAMYQAKAQGRGRSRFHAA